MFLDFSSSMAAEHASTAPSLEVNLSSPVGRRRQRAALGQWYHTRRWVGVLRIHHAAGFRHPSLTDDRCFMN